MKKIISKIGSIFFKKTRLRIKNYKKILNQDSLYPTKERKSKCKRLFELIYLRHKVGYGLVLNYNKYGLDVKNHHDYHDYIDATFMRRNIYKKGLPKYNHITSDKFLTYCYLSNINPDITPEVINYFRKGKTILKCNKAKTVEEQLDLLKNGDKICFKLVLGQGGIGFFLVEKENNKIIINKNKCSIDNFYKEIKQKKLCCTKVYCSARKTIKT